MSRYTEAACKLCRREGTKLYLKGVRCETEKCSVGRRAYPPGQHAEGRRRDKKTHYGIQLREKQKVKRIYGIAEKQFRTYYKRASRLRGITGALLLQLLERRLALPRVLVADLPEHGPRLEEPDHHPGDTLVPLFARGLHHEDLLRHRHQVPAERG